LENKPVQQLKTRGAGDLKGTMHHARVSRRYSLKEVVIFSCKSEDALLPPLSGFTENVSTTGIAFLTEGAVEVGSQISLNLQLRSATDRTKTILLHAEGTVLRVELAGNRNKVAAEIRFQEDLEEDFAVPNMIQ
jgi:c-di-GMP-binding flagellar brake protein YcgR